MIRVVLDTNIIISALLSPLGTPAEVLVMAITDPELQLCISPVIFAEYREVLSRPKFHRTQVEIDAALVSIRSTSLWVLPTSRVEQCTDPDDNIFLECAQAADAHFLITGNVKHFPARFGQTNIVTPRQFLSEAK